MCSFSPTERKCHRVEKITTLGTLWFLSLTKYFVGLSNEVGWDCQGIQHTWWRRVNVFVPFLWRSEGESLLGWPRHKWERNVKPHLKKNTKIICMGLSGSGCGLVESCSKHGNELSDSIKCGDFYTGWGRISFWRAPRVILCYVMVLLCYELYCTILYYIVV